MKLTSAVILGLVAASLATSVAMAQSQAAEPLRFVSTEGAPKAAGPYSQAVVHGGLLYAAGQTPRDPATGKQVADSFEAAADRVMDNLEAVLKADGLDWSDVIKVTVYLTKQDDFAALNAIYAKRLGAAKPARTTVIVAAIPNAGLLEIDLIARARK